MDLRTIRANGLEFAYYERGKGPLVLLLHGFPDDATTWDRTLDSLSRRGYRAVAPYMRGYYPTEIPPDRATSMETLGRDALGLAAALSDEPAIVIGHDWGATAAYAAAALEPDAWRLVVTMAIPYPIAVLPTPRVLWAVRHFLALQLPGAQQRFEQANLAGVDALWQRWSPAWRVPPEETASVKETFRHPGSLRAALGYYRAIRPPVPKLLRGRIRADTVCIAGRDDIIDPSWYRRAARYFEGGYEVLEMRGGHFMHREHPELFEETLLDALTRHAPPA